MDIRQAYNKWSSQYDTVENKTRDLEGHALRTLLSHMRPERVLEIGCGTGKNTEWLLQRSAHVTAVDLSEEMLAKAKGKITSSRVRFVQADITQPWTFAEELADLVTFSLVLEHIENLDHIFSQVAASLTPGGLAYLGELHPVKQYGGSKARFETADGLQILSCYTHHISDFIQSAKRHHLDLLNLEEYFDEETRTGMPRILAILFRKHL